MIASRQNQKPKPRRRKEIKSNPSQEHLDRGAVQRGADDLRVPCMHAPGNPPKKTERWNQRTYLDSDADTHPQCPAPQLGTSIPTGCAPGRTTCARIGWFLIKHRIHSPASPRAPAEVERAQHRIASTESARDRHGHLKTHVTPPHTPKFSLSLSLYSPSLFPL